MSRNHLEPLNIKQEIKELIGLQKKLNKLTERVRKTCLGVDRLYAPRAKFERWRDSNDGKEWKQKQYEKQGCRCHLCGSGIELKGSHIDHMESIAKSPQLACDPRNLQILCPDCNTKKGSQ